MSIVLHDYIAKLLILWQASLILLNKKPVIMFVFDQHHSGSVINISNKIDLSLKLFRTIKEKVCHMLNILTVIEIHDYNDGKLHLC